MAWSFSNSVGYRGYASINGTAVLATGGNINVTQDPITSQGVWGATPNVAAQIVAWAYNYLRVEGSVSYDLTKGNVYDAINTFAFSNREAGGNVILKPDGGNGFNGTGYCSGATFSCSEGQIVTGDINFIGDAGASGADSAIIANGNSNAGTGESQYSTIFSGGSGGSGGSSSSASVAGEGAVIAYWATKVKDVTDAISWNCSYNSDIQLLKCCTGADEPPVGADYVLLGDMSGDGSFTVFTLKGDFAPSGYHGVKSDFDITVGDAGTIKIPYAIINSGSTAIQTGSSYITADFNFTAVGDGQHGPISLSDGSGSSGSSGSGN